MNTQIPKKISKPKKRFTIRPTDEMSVSIRYNYELFRMQLLKEGKPMQSLNQYICEILTRGIESIASEPKTRKEP